MQDKTKKSNYLITKIFATDYFHYYCRPIVFCTYFLPYQLSKNGRFFTYREDEYEKKMQDIKSGMFGKYGNYASQGFGNVAFYEPCVSHNYFYDRLCSYEKQKENYFVLKLDAIQNMEDMIMKEDLIYILSDRNLKLKKGVKVPEGIKEQLKRDLEIYDNKYVLAELFYYIISERHVLPDVRAEQMQQQVKRFEKKEILNMPNIHIDTRATMDETPEMMELKLMEAVEIQMIFFNGISLLDSQKSNTGFSLVDFLKRREEDGTPLVLEIIISEPESPADYDACDFKENYEHRYIPKKKLTQKSIFHLEQICREDWNAISIKGKTTRVFLPYAMMIVKNRKEALDYIKVDIYSPYIREKRERPCFYIFRNINGNLFEHFQNVFYHIWNDDCNSKFIGGMPDDK